MKQSECVKVVVRCRPMSKQEKIDNRGQIVNVNHGRGEVALGNPKADQSEAPKIFTFDLAYEPDCKQEDIYKETAFPIVESVLQGYNGTIFAYGQTGTGKTHTMEGKDDPPTMRGIIPRSFDHIFNSINGSPGVQFLVRASFLELYNEEVRDLLSKNLKKLEIREKSGSGIYVKDLSSFMIQDAQELREKLQHGRENRAVGATNMNQDSSRSHSIFSITIETSVIEKGEQRITQGKLNLVDLAGSERQSKTQAQGDRFKEAININQSLTTLGNVISALVDQKSSHIPYRDSKLTRLLQDSLGGNTKTVMVANVGPVEQFFIQIIHKSYNYDETLSTLRYANRAKAIKNKPKINEDPKDAMIRSFQEEISKLKEQLASQLEGQEGGGGGGGTVVEYKEKIIQVHDNEKVNEMERILKKETEEMERRTEEERKKILQQKSLAEEQRAKLLQKLKEKEDIQRAAREQQEKMLKKIKKMEEKVIQGSAIMEEAMKKERELVQHQQMIEEKQERERRLAEELKEKEDLTSDLQKKYNNQKEEAEHKTKRIKQLWQKLKVVENENKETDEFYGTEIEELQERRRNLTKELKLKNLILEYFIPEKELERLQMRAVFNEEIDDWMYPNLHLAGNILRMQGNDQKDAIHKQELEEIEKLELDGHPNVYFVYTEEGPVREEEIAPQDRKKKEKTNSRSNKPGSAKKRPQSKGGNKRPQSGKKQNPNQSIVEKKQQDVELFPQAKGLVKTKKIY